MPDRSGVAEFPSRSADRGDAMSKQSKKRAKRARTFLSGMMLFIPAMLAAATAFFNAVSINQKGGMRALLDDIVPNGGTGSSGSSKSRKRGK
jgi:hypothetical protein